MRKRAALFIAFFIFCFYSVIAFCESKSLSLEAVSQAEPVMVFLAKHEGIFNGKFIGKIKVEIKVKNNESIPQEVFFWKCDSSWEGEDNWVTDNPQIKSPVMGGCQATGLNAVNIPPGESWQIQKIFILDFGSSSPAERNGQFSFRIGFNMFTKQENFTWPDRKSKITLWSNPVTVEFK